MLTSDQKTAHIPSGQNNDQHRVQFSFRALRSRHFEFFFGRKLVKTKRGKASERGTVVAEASESNKLDHACVRACVCACAATGKKNLLSLQQHANDRAEQAKQ
ncbi:hypothetical protein ABZP36_006047 [Zizania latifolia]